MKIIRAKIKKIKKVREKKEEENVLKPLKMEPVKLSPVISEEKQTTEEKSVESDNSVKDLDSFIESLNSEEQDRLFRIIKKYMSMNYAEFLKVASDIKSNPSKYTVEEALISQYIKQSNMKDKFLLDWVNRHVEKTSQNNKNFHIIIEFVDK
ncbi:MAG: hypothetical protein NZZ41_04310 [Candidatus Dojkabacteria bacterium]|nr:hypothetical protein [Candidatus Dojkabacteria bacterium]